MRDAEIIKSEAELNPECIDGNEGAEAAHSLGCLLKTSYEAAASSRRMRARGRAWRAATLM